MWSDNCGYTNRQPEICAGEFDSPPVELLNKEVGLIGPSIGFLSLKLVLTGKLTHFLQGLLTVDSKCSAEMYS